MKRIFLLVIVIIVALGCNTEEPLPPNTFEIKGTAKGLVNGLRSHLNVIDDRKRMVSTDTTIIMNEEFVFTGEIKNPTIRVLSVNSVSGNIPIIVEPGKMSIEIDKDNILNSVVSGSENNEKYSEYLRNYLGIRAEIDSLRKLARRTDQTKYPELVKELKEKDIATFARLNTYTHEFIKENPNSDTSLLLLESQILGSNQNLEKFKESYKTLERVINRNAYNKQIGVKIKSFIGYLEAQASTDIGNIAPNFSSPTPDGEMLALNDIKGKATIIDFWASWCGPCRRENPNVVKVYEKYHDKGLEIISVSLDKPGQKDRWLKAIEDDKLAWHHVGSLKYFNDPVARLYNINAIPAMFVLDESGTIVGKKLRGQALHDKISELLD
ncbi:TlpA disulfide reductase family protein [Flavobacteriaceae sp. LMIT009]